MGVVENKQIVHETFAALTAGDADKFLSYLSDDVRWTVIGTTSFSHTYAGKADILDRLVSRGNGTGRRVHHQHHPEYHCRRRLCRRVNPG